MITTTEPPYVVTLIGWKAIAAYFCVSTGTVKRWHRERPLPVYRLGTKRGPVRADVPELEKWTDLYPNGTT